MSLTGSQASTEAISPAIQDILNEIAFQKVILKSLDDLVENREEADREVRAEIKSLEKQLRDLKRGTTETASNSVPTSSQPATRTSPLTSTKSTAVGDRNPQMSGNASQAYDSFNMRSASSIASYPNSTMDPLPDLTSPISLRNRKRTHSKHLDSGFKPFSENKSRRTSPSPYMMGAAMTPGSSSDDDDFPPLDEDFLLQMQKQEEKMKQEKLDAEFAKAMQDESSFAAMMTAPSSRPPSRVPSAFDRMVGMQPQKSSSQAPPVRPSHPASSPQRTGLSKTELKAVPYDSPNVNFPAYTSKPKHSSSKVKAEQASARQMPGTFLPDNSSDSDIEIIDSTEFNDNGRYSRSTPRTSSANPFGTPGKGAQQLGFTPASQNAGDERVRRFGQSNTNSPHLAMFGNRQQRGPSRLNGVSPGSSLPSMDYSGRGYAQPFGAGNYMNTGVGMRGSGQNPFANPNATFVNGFGSADGNGIGSMPGSFPSGTMQASGDHLGYTVNSIPTYGGYNPSRPAPGSQDYSNSVPFVDLIRRTGTQAYGAMTDFFGRPMDEAMAGQVDYILNDPRKTNEEIKALLENIRPDLDLPAENREGTPTGLKYPLYEHQKIALTWLKSMEEGTNKGGILADDMGLGKTISTLALILSRPSTDNARKTTLIVGPVALVRQWEREIRQKINGSHRLSTHMVHGSNKKLSWDELKIFDIVLTTYGTLGAELKRLEKYVKQQRENGLLLDREIDQAPMRKLFPLLGPKSLWYRVILDEAQCIKNKSTISARAACTLKSVTRFCLTGTPMMNSVSELQSLIHFLRIKPYNDATAFKHAFGILTKGDSRQGDVTKGMQKLQALLRAIMLRRVKGSLIDGKPIIQLPPKTEEIQHVVFDSDEQAFYNALESKTQIQFNKYMRAGTVGKNYSNILVLLLRLRQCCCHPHLITDFEEAPAGIDLSVDEMKELAKSLESDVVGRLIDANGTFDCPICYDATTNPSIIIPCGHDTCSECLTRIADSQTRQNVANGEEGGVIKCPSCRGTIDMKKIIDYSTFKKIHMPEPDANDEMGSEISDSDEDSSESESDDETASESDADKNGDLRGFIVPDTFLEETESENEEDDDPIEDEDGADEMERSQGSLQKKSKLKNRRREDKRRQKAKKGKRKEKKQTFTIATLKKEAARSKEGRRKYMRYLKKHWQPSAKVTKCVELLERFQNEKRKTIIFSQFVSLLDLLQVPIDEKGWKCERYDGSMNAEQRNDAIMRFTDKPTHNIMLISLKAGNAGLNLVAASRVIILDPFWNPYIEMQAVDRAYRIGQQNSIEVHRILIESTVEDRIIELQENKKKVINAALDEGAGKSVSRLGERELAFLFGVGV